MGSRTWFQEDPPREAAEGESLPSTLGVGGRSFGSTCTCPQLWSKVRKTIRSKMKGVGGRWEMGSWPVYLMLINMRGRESETSASLLDPVTNGLERNVSVVEV